MPSAEDKKAAVARVYAIAMLDLAGRKGEEESLLEELEQLVAYLDEHEDFDAVLASPMIDAAAREKTIERVFRGRASHLVVDSLQVINRKRRLDLLRPIAQVYRAAYRERKGLIEVKVRTPFPLTAKLSRRIREVVSGALGKEAQLSASVDETLLGGMIFQIGDQKIDTSLARELATFKEKLLERASREIRDRTEVYFSA